MQLAPDAETQNQSKVLQQARAITFPPGSIAQLANNRSYVGQDANLLDLSDDLMSKQEIQVVAVVDRESNSIIGIVQRKIIFDLLGRPFGRDVIKEEFVSKIALPAQSFRYDQNILAVLESLTIAKDPEPSYFAVESETGEFLGTFSSYDLLLHVSELSKLDLEFVTAIQDRIFQNPSQLKSQSSELVFTNRAKANLGTDFCYSKEYLPGRLALALTKVFGQGLSRSLSSMTLWGIVRTFDFRRGVHNFVTSLESFSQECFGEKQAAGGFFADLDTSSGELLVCDRNHGSAYLLRDDKLLKLKSIANNEPSDQANSDKLAVFSFGLQDNDLLIIIGPKHLSNQSSESNPEDLENLKKALLQKTSTSVNDLAKDLVAKRRVTDLHSPIGQDQNFILLRYRSLRSL